MSARPTHYAAGASLGLAVGQVGVWAAHWSTAVAVGVAASSMWAAPSLDVDQRGWWRDLDRILPDEWLGGGGPLAHRGATHWVAWPVLAFAGWWWLLTQVPQLGPVWWAGIGVTTGWASHLIMDFFYGHDVRTPEGAIIVRHGIPLVGWYRHVGGIWTSSGPGSAFAGFLLACAAVAQTVALLGGWARCTAAIAAHPGALGGFAVLIAGCWLLGERKPRRSRRQTSNT